MTRLLSFLVVWSLLLGLPGWAQQIPYSFKPENPVTPEWISDHCATEHPRIILTPERLGHLKLKIDNDELIRAYYQHIKYYADSLCASIPPLERNLIGRRLLQVSREAISRISSLALVANIEIDNHKYVSRLNDEIVALCNFHDWNPSHFLDVAEMSLAVSIGVDWCYNQLPEATIQLAKTILIEKALTIEIDHPNDPGWSRTTNNWNQVCNGGLSAGAILIAEDDPELASKVISRALRNLPNALKAYAPDGVYPEGVSYWIYATYYSAFMVEMSTTAFGTDFNLMSAPGFKQSALFANRVVTESGKAYNYFDSSRGIDPITYWPLLAWFDVKQGAKGYFKADPLNLYLSNALEIKRNIRWFTPISIIWLSEIPESSRIMELPDFWIGNGPNPLAVFRLTNDPRGFFFGIKGGQANLSHGNMDAGSFIFNLDGVSWAVDLGMQDYTYLESIMGDQLWNSSQNSRRWELISKNNFGHSTITVNDQLFKFNAFSGLERINDSQEGVRIDLTDQYNGNVQSAERMVTKHGRYGIRFHDRLIPNNLTEKIVWSLLTQASVTFGENRITLSQEGKELEIMILKPAQALIQVISLDPPPLEYDMKVKKLKRIEITQYSTNPITNIEFEVILGEQLIK